MPVPHFWPRLYLDTGDLIDIADGRIVPDVVRELTTSCEEHAVLLVLSSAHLQDALMPEDPVSVDRFAAALELFRFRCLVMKGPDVVEPWLTRGVAQDIEIEGCSNIREILTHSAAAPNLASMREVQDAIHRAALSSNVARQVIDEVPIPKHHRPIALQSTITQIRGWMGDDPVPIVLHHLEQDGGSPHGERDSQPYHGAAAARRGAERSWSADRCSWIRSHRARETDGPFHCKRRVQGCTGRLACRETSSWSGR